MISTACRASRAVSISILLLAGVTAAADAQHLRDFEEIQATSVVVTPDPGGRSAVLQVDTTIEVACSVVYGEDESFGLIAVDNDMDGGAHADHQPVLAGLEPDTTYTYRLQGTAPDGALYVSKLMTFRTPPAPVGGPIDLALDATISGVSSEWSEAFAAANAIDGDPTTEWSSRGDGDDAWIEIDLGSPRWIDEVEFRTRSMSDGTAQAYTYAITADGVLIGDYPVESTVVIDLEARVLRFDVTSSSGGNTGAIEILVLDTGDA